MTFIGSYHAAVLAVMQARQADSTSNLMSFLGKQKPLIDDLNQRWTGGLGSEGLPSPDQVILMLVSALG
jgi:hypothetical protein